MKKAEKRSTGLRGYEQYLREGERSPQTIEKYLRDIGEFLAWAGGKKRFEKQDVLLYKEYLLSTGLKPSTVNTRLAALNAYFRFLGREDCRVKYLRLQRRMFRATDRTLTKKEYDCLLETAHAQGQNRLALLMETICSTGIRVSEVRYITVEAAQAGQAQVSLKGKIRSILLPGKLCRKLLKYAKKQKIASGEIFLTRSGKSLCRKQIWKQMKDLCRAAGVTASKVFPHNLRHLFATAFYRVCRDIVKLAGVLGHSSIETTRIYLLTTSSEHIKVLNRLGLVS